MFGINLKVLVAIVTELCTHSISAMTCTACHAPEICILHTSANCKVKDTFFLKQIIFIKSLNSVFFMYVPTESKLHVLQIKHFLNCNIQILMVIINYSY